MINETWERTARIKNGRTVKDVMCSVAEEVGELATEVRIKYGQSYKVAGPDGIQGEAIDAIAAILDLIKVDNPDLTIEEVMRTLDYKLNKWELKESTHALSATPSGKATIDAINEFVHPEEN